MIDLAAIFMNKELDPDKLSDYGFTAIDNGYFKEFSIMQGQFVVRISIQQSGKADFKVYDTQSKDEYVLAHVSKATGTFVGEVHAAIETILTDIVKECYHTEYFKGEQSKRILRYISEKYQAEPEFLWSSLPECAALRVPGKKPWFAVVGRVEKAKFGLQENGIVEVINLKDDPKCVTAHIKNHVAYPAYHMNKQHWYSLFMDDTLSDDEIIALIEKSYAIVNT